MVCIKKLTLSAALVLTLRGETDAEAVPGAKHAKHENKKDHSGNFVSKSKPGATIKGGVAGRDLEEREEARHIEFVERNESKDLAERDFNTDDLYERYLDPEDLAERDFDIDALYERYLGADDLVEREFESDDLYE